MNLSQSVVAGKQRGGGGGGGGGVLVYYLLLETRGGGIQGDGLPGNHLKKRAREELLPVSLFAEEGKIWKKKKKRGRSGDKRKTEGKGETGGRLLNPFFFSIFPLQVSGKGKIRKKKRGGGGDSKKREQEKKRKSESGLGPFSISTFPRSSGRKEREKNGEEKKGSSWGGKKKNEKRGKKREKKEIPTVAPAAISLHPFPFIRVITTEKKRLGKEKKEREKKGEKKRKGGKPMRIRNSSFSYLFLYKRKGRIKRKKEREKKY